MHILGIDIGGTKTAVILGTDKPSILNKEVFATGSPEDSLETITRIAQKFLSEHPGIRVAGVSCGGPLSSKDGIILGPPNLPGWDRVEICSRLSSVLGIEVILQNDANACAWAEYLWGGGRGCRSMAFLTFGTGLGAGLILNGALYSGVSDMAGEIGHIRLADKGPWGYGKQGSFEGFCSGGGLARLAEKRLQENPPDSADFLRFLGGRPLTAKELSVAAKEKNPFALGIFRESGFYLGKGLAVLLDILNLERVIIGSMFVRMEEYFRPSMMEALEQECLPHCRDACRIIPSELGESIGDYAALGLALKHEGGLHG